jgi:hypothetical protein
MPNQTQVQNQAIESIPATNPLEVSNPISAIVNSQSPTAIIIAIALLLSVLIGSITKLVYVILMSQSSRHSKRN